VLETAKREPCPIMRNIPSLEHKSTLPLREGRNLSSAAKKDFGEGSIPAKQNAPPPENAFGIFDPPSRGGLKPCLAIIAILFSAALPTRAETVARHHMIAAANPYVVKAGLSMLRQGGSAVDAAIAAQMVLTLVEPESSGIGGGAFMLLWDPAKKKMTSFDGRETAPASATPTMFLDAIGQPRGKRAAIPGGLSVGVPGVVAMLDMAHKKYGKLPWAKLFQPAIVLAEKDRKSVV